MTDPGGRVTSELTPARDTQRIEAPATGRLPGRVFRSQRWRDALSAAGIAWLAVLCVGGVAALALKLQFPTFGRGADPIEIFTVVVVISLGLFGVPAHIGDLTISAIPLGALLAAGAAVAWATHGEGETPTRSTRDAFRQALRVAAVFAIVGLLLSSIFRLRGREVVAADAWWSLIATFLWGVLFAWAGVLRGPRSWMGHLKARTVSLLRAESRVSGLWGGVAMLVVAAILAGAALLLWVIVALARGGPGPGFGAGDAAAAVLYLVAFLPNVLTALIALGLGAPIVHGSQVGVAGRVIGGLSETSLLGPHAFPIVAYLLLVIPIVACTAGGWLLARLRETRAESWRPILIAALTFATSLGLLAWLGEARVGAGLVTERGVALLAVRPSATFAWGMLWATVFGWLGWELAMRRKAH